MGHLLQFPIHRQDSNIWTDLKSMANWFLEEVPQIYIVGLPLGSNFTLVPRPYDPSDLIYHGYSTSICPHPSDSGRYGWRGQDLHSKGWYEGRYKIIHVIIYLLHMYTPQLLINRWGRYTYNIRYKIYGYLFKTFNTYIAIQRSL